MLYSPGVNQSVPLTKGCWLLGSRQQDALLVQISKPVLKADSGKPNATELLALAEKLCERTANKREADLDRDVQHPRRGASVDMSVVMRRVAMARAEIADRDRLAKVWHMSKPDWSCVHHG